MEKLKLRGFTLIETAIVIIIAGLFVAAGARLYMVQIESKRHEVLEQSFRNIQAALTDYLDENGFYPCPAPRDAQPDTAAYGRATDCADISIAPGNCGGGVCVSADHGRRVRIGAVPIRDLGLSVGDYADPYGRQIAYAVTEQLAINVDLFDGNGDIDVVDGGGNSVLSTLASAHFVLFSHGRDGNGAYTVTGVENGRPCDTGAQDNENCDLDATFRSTEFSITDGAERFDDKIRHSLQFGQINVACPLGEVLVEIRNRQPICVSLQSLSCPVGQVLAGFDADGNPECVVYSSLAGFSCPDRQLVGAYDNDGTPICRENRIGEGDEGDEEARLFSDTSIGRDPSQVQTFCQRQGYTRGVCNSVRRDGCQSVICYR